MFDPLVLYRFCRHVDNADIITIYHCGRGDRMMELLQELVQPEPISHSMSNCMILSFDARVRDGSLSLGGPRNQVITKVDAISESGTACVGTLGPISGNVDSEGGGQRSMNLKAIVKSAFDVP